MRLGSKALAIGVMSVLLTGGTSWGQEHHDHDHEDFYSGTRAVLRSNEDDVALHDGSPYTQPRGSAATLFDSPPGTEEDNPSDWDYLVFGPKDGRRLLLSSDLVDGDPSTPGNQPLVCGRESYLFFGRFSEDRDWVEELSAVGDSTTGDAAFHCWIDDPTSPGSEHRYYNIVWYHQGLRTTGLCVNFSRTHDKTLRFEAPPATVSPVTGLPLPLDDGCPAEIFLMTRTKADDPEAASGYTHSGESLGYASAPLQLTVRFAGKFL